MDALKTALRKAIVIIENVDADSLECKHFDTLVAAREYLEDPQGGLNCKAWVIVGSEMAAIGVNARGYGDPTCGHSACSQNYIDTGSTVCLELGDCGDCKEGVIVQGAEIHACQHCKIFPNDEAATAAVWEMLSKATEERHEMQCDVEKYVQSMT